MTRRLHSIIQTRQPLRLTEDHYLRLEDEMTGICRACGEERETCEPDARNYDCPACGRMEVYGIEELLARGELEIIE